MNIVHAASTTTNNHANHLSYDDTSIQHHNQQDDGKPEKVMTPPRRHCTNVKNILENELLVNIRSNRDSRSVAAIPVTPVSTCSVVTLSTDGFISEEPNSRRVFMTMELSSDEEDNKSQDYCHGCDNEQDQCSLTSDETKNDYALARHFEIEDIERDYDADEEGGADEDQKSNHNDHDRSRCDVLSPAFHFSRSSSSSKRCISSLPLPPPQPALDLQNSRSLYSRFDQDRLTSHQEHPHGNASPLWNRENKRKRAAALCVSPTGGTYFRNDSHCQARQQQQSPPNHCHNNSTVPSTIDVNATNGPNHQSTAAIPMKISSPTLSDNNKALAPLTPPPRSPSSKRRILPLIHHHQTTANTPNSINVADSIGKTQSCSVSTTTVRQPILHFNTSASSSLLSSSWPRSRIDLKRNLPPSDFYSIDVAPWSMKKSFLLTPPVKNTKCINTNIQLPNAAVIHYRKREDPNRHDCSSNNQFHNDEHPVKSNEDYEEDNSDNDGYFSPPQLKRKVLIKSPTRMEEKTYFTENGSNYASSALVHNATEQLSSMTMSTNKDYIDGTNIACVKEITEEKQNNGEHNDDFQCRRKKEVTVCCTGNEKKNKLHREGTEKMSMVEKENKNERDHKYNEEARDNLVGLKFVSVLSNNVT